MSEDSATNKEPARTKPVSAQLSDPAQSVSTAPVRKRRPRVISEPQRLPVRTELTGSYARLPRPDQVEAATANSATAARQMPTAAAADPLAGLRAKDEELAGWGEKTEDLVEQMKREKPPHWG